MSGFSTITGDQFGSVMNADNASFDGTSRGGVLSSDGEIWIGSSVSPRVRVGNLIPGPGVNITNGEGSITIGLSGSGTAIDSFTTDLNGPISPDGNGNVAFTGSTNIFSDGGTSNTMRLNVQGTNHALFVGRGTNTASANLGLGTNGQVLIAGTGADPSFATLTSSDSSISFTTGSNTLSLQVSGGSTVGKTITGDSGGALSPSAGNWNLAGSGSISTSGSGSTLTTALTGLTNHALLVGAGTSTITKVGPSSTAGQVLQSAGASADPSFSTATFPSTATGTGKVLIADGTNWVASTPTFPNASATSGKFIRSDGTNWIASTPTLPTSAGTSGKVLQSDGTNYVESTATFPSTATGTGTLLRANGTNWVATTSTYPDTNAVSTLLYASSANVMSALATANSGVLTTSSSGVPSIDTTNFQVLSTGVQMKGNNTNTAPPAGFIGETITNTATAVSISNNTPTNITSISLTAGIWDISTICLIVNSGNNSQITSGPSATSATQTGTAGLDFALDASTISIDSKTLVVPKVRATLASTTTYYLVSNSVFTTGACSANGRITATRVG